MIRQIRSASKRVSFPLHIWAPLTEAEARLIGSVAAQAASSRLGKAPIRAGRGVRASIIRNLCLSPLTAQLLRSGPLEITDAEITGPLDLSFARIPFPVTFTNCRVRAPITLHHAHLPHLRFRGGELNGLKANGMTVDGDLVFSGRVRVRHGIALERATIGGNLMLSAARVNNAAGTALDCASVTVGGAILLDRFFSCGGKVNLYNARVRGDISLDSARINNPRGFAVLADLVKSDGGIFIRKARIRGEVHMRGAECRSNLEFDGTSVENGNGNAISLDQARIKGSLYLRQKFHAAGDVVFPGSVIGVDLDLDEATIEGAGAGTTALVASRVRVQGNVYLEKASVTGMVLLIGAHVGGLVRCREAVFEVREPTLAGEPRGVTSLNAKAITVQGSVEIDGGQTNALLDFRNARIGRNLEVRELQLEPSLVTGLLLENARVGGEFCWVRTQCDSGAKMVLSHARIGRLRHGRGSWPEDLYLGGCVYSTIDFSEPTGAPAPARSNDAVRATENNGKLLTSAARFFSIGQENSDPIRWLKRQKGMFDPQPYEQLSAVLRRSGYDDEAKQVAIAMEQARYKQTTDPVTRALSRAQGVFVEHGHSTRRLWALSFLWVLIAAFWFGQAKHALVMTTANEEVYLDSSYGDAGEPKEYPRFNAFVYSLDAFLPIIELRQEAYWIPNAKLPCRIRGTAVDVPACGGLFRLYLWLHIILGWLATTLMVFSVTGLIRQHNSSA